MRHTIIAPWEESLHPTASKAEDAQECRPAAAGKEEDENGLKQDKSQK